MVYKDIEHSPQDGWPDGIFSCDFSLTEYKESDLLIIHWANKASGGEVVMIMPPAGKRARS